MWRRSDLKDRARWVMKNCYWKAVLISLILAIITGESFGVGSRGTAVRTREMVNGNYSAYWSEGWSEGILAFLGVISAAVIVLLLIGIAVSIFVFNPLEVNAKRFLIIARVQPADLSELGFSFKYSYMNVVKIQFLRALYTSLWTLLFIVPGIIKAYEYRMIPYILAENPEMDCKEAFQISKDMMYGEKWDTFVLDLSFLGWSILSGFTCGLLAVFYVNPYIQLTMTELYDVLKQKLFGPAPESQNGQNPNGNGYQQNGGYNQNPNTYQQDVNSSGSEN